MGVLTHVPRSASRHRVGMSEQFSTITLRDGRRLCFIEYGPADGPAVLYFHGAGASALAHPPGDAGADDLGVRLLAVERPGIGGSDPKPGRRLTDWPQDVAELVDALGIDRFSVLGWSAGGPHALACAAALPDRIAACGVLFGAVALDWPDWRDGVADEMLPFLETILASPATLRELLVPMTEDAEAFSLMFVERDLSSASLLDDAEVVGQVRADARRAFAQGPDAMLRDCELIYSTWDFDVADICLPVTLLYGSEDTTCPVAWGAHLARRIPTADLVVIDGVGHNHGYDRGVFRAAVTAVIEVADARR